MLVNEVDKGRSISLLSFRKETVVLLLLPAKLFLLLRQLLLSVLLILLRATVSCFCVQFIS